MEMKEQSERVWKELTAAEYFLGSQTLFNEPVYLFREALQSYEAGYFMASTLLCRSSLESALYRIAVVKDIRFHDAPDGKRSIWTYNSVDSYLEIGESYGLMEKRAMMNYPAVKDLLNEAQYVRRKGNFVAHYSPKIDEGYANRMMITMKGEDYASQPIQLWIDESTALEVLEKTSGVIRRLILAVFSKE